MDWLYSQESRVLGQRPRLARGRRGARKMLAHDTGGLQIRGPRAEGETVYRPGGLEALGEQDRAGPERGRER